MQGSKDAVKREKCQGCGCMKMINNHYLREGGQDRVFVECAQCGALVARYIIDASVNQAFCYERILKLAGGEGQNNGRRVMEEVQKHQARSKPQFERVVEPIVQEEEEPTPQLYFRRDIIEDE